jgi:hypothetical protein
MTRVAVCLVAAAVAVIACAVDFPGSGRSASNVAACEPGSVVVWLEALGDPGAGSAWDTLVLTNLSGHGCSVRGYPGVSAVDLARHQVGSAAARNPRFPVKTVLLKSGRSARFLLQVNDPGFFPNATCRPTTAAGLRVYLPGETTASVVPVALGACSRPGPAFLHTTAVTG